jgi:RNA polymerase sigma factor (TIGR02999 family)
LQIEGSTLSEKEATPEKEELAKLIPLAYQELRLIAQSHFSDLQRGATLSPTDLVNEVLLRLLKREEQQYHGTEHLIRVSVRAMHNVLVDQARRRIAAKRGGQHKRVKLDTELPIAAPVKDMLSFHEACEALRSRSEEYFELLLLRVYAGLSLEQIAEQRGQSTRTVQRQWKFIKAILHRHLSAAEESRIV